MLYFPRMHKESGLCYKILKICKFEKMMFALKIEMCLKNYWKSTWKWNSWENHWISLEIRNWIGKWILRKTWILGKSIFEIWNLLFWENGFENLEKVRKFIGKWFLKWKMDSLETGKLGTLEKINFWKLGILKFENFKTLENLDLNLGNTLKCHLKT